MKPLGLASDVVRLVDHDPRWAELYRAEAERLAWTGLALEHVGSTSIPGLAAKPILDITAGYTEGGLQRAIAALISAGYEHRGENGLPGREFFRRGEPPAYHLHLVLLDGPLWREHLAFRDALRADGALRDEYARIKRSLAAAAPKDRDGYLAGKAPFIRRVLAGA